MSNAAVNPKAVEAPSAEPSVARDQESFPHIEAVLSAPEVTQTFGSIEGREDASFLVRTGAELVRARRAKGCLVEPEIGDTVLVARSEHHAFVLSVLVGRADSTETVLAVDGDLTLRSNDGQVAVVGGDGVSVTTSGELAVNAPAVVARTMNATLFADTLSYVGRKLEAHVERARWIGQALETAIDTVTSRVKHSYRTIEELERVKAKELHVDAEATLSMSGKNTVVTAEKVVKLDGEQIHIG